LTIWLFLFVTRSAILEGDIGIGGVSVCLSVTGCIASELMTVGPCDFHRWVAEKLLVWNHLSWTYLGEPQEPWLSLWVNRSTIVIGNGTIQ